MPPRNKAVVQRRIRNKRFESPFTKQEENSPQNKVAKGMTEPAPGGFGYVLTKR